jgi:hypothetical protein
MIQKSYTSCRALIDVIPNFKNFLSLHIFAKSLAEKKHALKISEHAL